MEFIKYQRFSIDKNIELRIYDNGTKKYRVYLRPQRRNFIITFDTEYEAREWLEKNYYDVFKNPDKYFLEKKKKWI